MGTRAAAAAAAAAENDASQPDARGLRLRPRRTGAGCECERARGTRGAESAAAPAPHGEAPATVGSRGFRPNAGARATAPARTGLRTELRRKSPPERRRRVRSRRVRAAVPRGRARRASRSRSRRPAARFRRRSGAGAKARGTRRPRARARGRGGRRSSRARRRRARAPATSRSSSRHRERRSFHPPTACGFLSPQPACVESPASAELEAICVSVFSHDTGVRDARQSSPDGLKKKKKTSLLRVERRADHPRAARTENCFCADVRGDAWEARRRGGSRRTACAAAFASEPPTALVKPPSHWGARASPAEFSKSGIFVGRKGGA